MTLIPKAVSNRILRYAKKRNHMELKVIPFSWLSDRFLRAVQVPQRVVATLFCSAALLMGCTKDLNHLDTPELPAPPLVESGSLLFSISIPGVTNAAPGSYALTPEGEGFVDTDQFNVLLFSAADPDATDNDYLFDRYVPATELNVAAGDVNNQGHYVKYFRIDLPQNDNTKDLVYKVMVVANYMPEVDGETTEAKWKNLLGGLSLEKARGRITFEQAEGTVWNTGNAPTPLPLWGETLSPFTAQMLRVATIPMLRAVARIDVGVNLGGALFDEEGNPTGAYDLSSPDYNGKMTDRDGQAFTLESVTLYNAARTGYIAPAHGNLSQDGRTVTAPTCDNVLYHGDQRPRYTLTDNGGATNMLRRQIYLPETPNKVDENAQAFYIVVGGRYGGGNTTYYRIDFYDRAANPEGAGTEHEDYVKPSATNRYDILRNHAYVINILRVRGEGYPTPEMAASSEPINMEVDIRSWDTGDNMGNVVTDGQYYLSLSSTQLRYHQDGTAQELEVMTDFHLENDPTASGWRLLMQKEQIAEENNYNHADDVKVWVETANGWEEASKTEYNNDTNYWLWTTGAANVTGRVRLGLNRFDESNQSGLMERTVRLLFTAGRMSQAVELVQDVKNTRTLSLLQQKLFFPKYPLRNQSVILKSSPSGATYYLVWNKEEQGEKKVYRANLSDPDADDAATVTGREGYIGGINKATPDQLPAGFDCKQDHVDDASCTAIELFVKGSENMFALRPSAWDATHNGNKEPQQPRTWRFEIEAYWDGDGTPDSNPERVKLDVEQSNYEVKWYPAKDQASKDTPLADNTYTVPWNATEATPYIMTTPADLSWYFISKSDEGNLSGREWVTNWMSELQGEPRQGEGTVNVALTQNDNLLPRMVTFQASSAADGFDKTSAILKIRQEGGPFILTMHPGVGVAELPYDDAKKTYTLDFGMSAVRMMRTLNVRANTDWWWEWRKDGNDEMGDRTANTSAYLDQYPTPIHINNEHPYWKNEAVPEKENPGYVINEWLPAPSASTAPGIDNGTTGNSDENSTTRLWENALYMRSVTGVFLSPLAISDESITQSRTIPVAGTYYSEIQLYNKHDLFPTDEASDPDGANQAKVDAASKILRVQRTVPSLLYLAKLPFNGNNDVNLSNFTTEELGTTPGDARLWDQQRLTIRSNNKVTITLYDCQGMDENQLTQCGQTVYKPTKYEQVVDITLADLKRDNGKEFIIADDVPYDDTKQPRIYRIKIEGWRQSVKDGPDEAFTQELTYHSGYWINHPTTAQVVRGSKFTNEGFDLLLDFAGSVYHKDQRVRIGRQKVSVGTYNYNSTDKTGSYIQTAKPEGEPEYTEYKLDGSLYQRYIRYTVPENTEREWMYIYWVEYLGKVSGEWSTTWSGGVEGTKPEIGKYLFLQEAQAYNSLVTLQNGPVVPAAPNWRMSPSNYDTNFIQYWYNYEDNPASIRYWPWVVPNYSEYCESFTCGVTGEEFAITSEQNESANGLKFNEWSTIDAYQKSWGKTGHIFKKTRTWLEGKHWFVGSRLHTRSVWDETEDISIYNVKCPDNHGLQRRVFQQFTACEVYYRTSQSDSERGPLQLIVVRHAITKAPNKNIPPYSTLLQGSQVTH